jgi:hypothetical protein
MPDMGGRTYSPAELERIRAEYATASSVEDLARSMGRPAHGLKEKAIELGLRRPRPEPAAWRTKIIAARYPSDPDPRSLAEELGLTYSALKAHAHRFGIQRDPAFFSASRALGSARSAERRKAASKSRIILRAVQATPLDAAWRGLLIGE